MKNWNMVAALLCVLTLGAARADDKPKLVELPKGIELLAIKLDKPAAEGFVGPGSRVDVVFQTKEPKTTVVFDNVLVYAVDTVATTNGEVSTTIYSVGATKMQAKLTTTLVGDGVKPQLILRKPDKK